VYAVDADKPPSVYVVAEVVPTSAPSRKIRYPATPVSSFEADQLTVNEVEVVLDSLKFEGIDGAVVSPAPDVPAVTGDDSADEFPAASTAATAYAY
jgi:hypothetical protein